MLSVKQTLSQSQASTKESILSIVVTNTLANKSINQTGQQPYYNCANPGEVV